MNDPDTSYTSIPRDRALVAVDSDASPGAIAERARAWLRDVALRVRHDEGLDSDTGQPRRRCPLPLVTQDLTAITDPAEELRGLYEDQCRWDREARAYAGN